MCKFIVKGNVALDYFLLSGATVFSVYICEGVTASTRFLLGSRTIIQQQFPHVQQKTFTKTRSNQTADRSFKALKHQTSPTTHSSSLLQLLLKVENVAHGYKKAVSCSLWKAPHIQQCETLPLQPLHSALIVHFPQCPLDVAVGDDLFLFATSSCSELMWLNRVSATNYTFLSQSQMLL